MKELDMSLSLTIDLSHITLFDSLREFTVYHLFSNFGSEKSYALDGVINFYYNQLISFIEKLCVRTIQISFSQT